MAQFLIPVLILRLTIRVASTVYIDPVNSDLLVDSAGVMWRVAVTAHLFRSNVGCLIYLFNQICWFEEAPLNGSTHSQVWK